MQQPAGSAWSRSDGEIAVVTKVVVSDVQLHVAVSAAAWRASGFVGPVSAAGDIWRSRADILPSLQLDAVGENGGGLREQYQQEREHIFFCNHGGQRMFEVMDRETGMDETHWSLQTFDGPRGEDALQLNVGSAGFVQLNEHHATALYEALGRWLKRRWLERQDLEEARIAWEADNG